MKSMCRRIFKLLVAFAGLAFAAILTYDMFDRRSVADWPDPFIKSPERVVLISHAGGGLPQGDYSNSLEALERAENSGFTYFEVDMNWTSDGKLVLIHDWHREYDVWFERPFLRKVEQRLRKNTYPFTRDGFMRLKFRHDLTQLDLEGLMAWVKANPNVRIVTDIKEENIAGLQLIALEFPDLLENMIPQIYQLSEYDPVSRFGFNSIIFTSYASDASSEEIVAFNSAHDLYAVTVPYERLNQENLKIFESLRAPLWTHTINDPAYVGWLSMLGVDGIYTDYLVP